MPWYIPHIRGVKLSTAIAHQFDLVNQHFKCNPYNIGARWFWTIVIASVIFSGGHLAIGTIEAFKIESPASPRSYLALTKGFLNGIPVVWMLLAFCFPALIAPLQEQLDALGIKVDHV